MPRLYIMLKNESDNETSPETVHNAENEAD